MIAALRNVSKFFGTNTRVQALRGVTLEINAGERLIIVGRSGSGKSTLARCLAGWEAPDAGTIHYADGVKTQLIPQEPGASLNPRFTAIEIVSEPYRIKGIKREQAADLAASWIERVELPAQCGEKMSSEFSGGEQARLAIARAMAAIFMDERRPGLLIFDESFSALDRELRSRLFTLLIRLQSQFAATYLFIAHEILLAGQYADRIAVMEEGAIVECGKASQVMFTPSSDAMLRLVAASKRGTPC